MSDTHREIQQIVEQGEAVAAAYHAAVKHRRLKPVLLVEMRCRDRGCLLLHVWQSPAGLCFYKPSYKVEHNRNLSTSNDAGRAANTTDGGRRWREDAGVLQAWEGHTMRLDCDHLNVSMASAEIVAMAGEGSPGKPVRPRLAK